jgi:post-segregation antitoxin (ccd killing protein)
MKNKPLFDSLMEFEKTKKIRTKIRLNFTIDKSVASQFKKFCRENGYNMSAKIEEAMRKIVKKE